MDKKLMKFLSDKNIDYILHNHPAVHTVEESKNMSEIVKIPGIRTKNLFLKDENNLFYLICMRGEKRLDIKNLEKNLSIKHLKFASPKELKEELNLKPGSVSIFGMLYAKNVNLIIDKETYDSEIISFHPNENTSTLELKHNALISFLNSIKINPKVIKL